MQFVILDVPHILLADLPRLVRIRPPPGWALHVTGGRRRRNRIDVTNADTLVIGYKYVCDSDASEPSFAPTTDDEEDEHGESDDPTSDHSLPGSTATTRSRSRRRRTRDQETEPSSDRSYQGGLDLIQRGSSMNPRAGPASRLFRCLPHGLMGQQGLPVDKLFQSIDPLALQWWPRLELLLAGNASAFASCAATLSLDTGHSLDTLGVAERLKLLVEPGPRTALQERRLDALRSAIEYLGGFWRYHASGTRLHAGLPLVEDLSSDEDAEERLRRASFVICTPGYDLERIVIEVRFPATLSEVQPLLRQACRRDRDLRLPHLTPASPQPTDGTGVFLATPHWCAGAAYACIDVTRVDGRLFAASLPTYVDRHMLLTLIQAHRQDVAFYVGLDQSPLQPDVLAHVVCGTTITVLPAGAAPPPLWDFGHMLLDAGQWSSHVMVPDLPANGAYCLVWESGHQLFCTDMSRPELFRAGIAEAIGEEFGDIEVTPAQPRVADAAVAGVLCHTVLAVTNPAPSPNVGRPQTVLLDGRPIQAGWLTWQAYNGLLFLPDLLQFLRHAVPPGHSLSFAGAPDLGTKHCPAQLWS